MNKLEGKWKLTIASMMGTETSTCIYKVDGSVLTGEVIDGKTGEVSTIESGTVSENTFSYKVTLKLPFGVMPFEITGQLLEDGTLKGKSAMPMGSSYFTGERIE